MGRKLGSTSASRITRDNHRLKSADASRMRADLPRGPHRGLEVVDDYPEVVPVTQRELDVIETYLGSLLDDLLKHNS
jgi:hypothetical protein